MRDLVMIVGVEECALLLDREDALARAVDCLQLARRERVERHAAPRQRELGASIGRVAHFTAA